MFNDVIKDIDGKYYSVSNLLQTKKKISVGNTFDAYPMTGIIKDMNTGIIYNLSDLFIGKKTEVNSNELKDYGMNALSGMIKDKDGQYINLIDLIYNAGKGSTGSDEGLSFQYSQEKFVGPIMNDSHLQITDATISTIAINEKYCFTTDQESLFIADGVFIFNGVSTSNDDTTKYLIAEVETFEKEVECYAIDEGFVTEVTMPDTSFYNILESNVRMVKI